MGFERTATIFVASGDHAGARQFAPAGSNSDRPVPSAFTIPIASPLAPSFVQNAIRVPSGDHAGWSSLAGNAFVTRVSFVPSAFAT